MQNIIWINNEKAKRLGNIDKDIAKFFQKSDNNSLLQFLLAKKVILVEGATEYILIPKIFKKILKKTLEEENIDIISCNGVTYKNFIHIAELMKKKVVVITDNDESQEKINEMNEYNQLHNNIKIYMDSNIQNWTWEVCLYNLNASELKNIIEIEDGAKYSYKGISYEDKPVLGKMLNNKSDTAYKIYMSNKEFEYPSYVTEALEWIKK